jgi:putative flippase GtrA
MTASAMTFLDRLDPDHRVLLLQMIRFGLTGGLLTVLVAGGYWLLATFAGVEPMLSLTLNFIVFTGLGYVLHSRFSFKGHGARDNAGARTVRFFTVNTIGFLTNQFFVWLLVRQLGGPTWWPVLPIIFVTPLLTFALNRRWVFA